MNIDIDTKFIEDYAVKLAKQQVRAQVGDLIKGEMDALKNASEMQQKILNLQRQVTSLEMKFTRLEDKMKKKWWQKKEE